MTVAQQPRASWIRRYALDIGPLVRHPAYRRLFIGNSVSFFGYQFTAVAVPVQVYALTRSQLWVGMVGFVGLVPLVVFSLWGGAIADALDRRKVLFYSSLLTWSTTLMLLAQALLGLGSPALILAMVALQAGAFGVTNPTRSAITPRLMPNAEVASANTLSFTASNVSTVAGPIVAGLVIGAFAHDVTRAVTISYAIDALAFTVALWASLRLPPLPPDRPAQTTPTAPDGTAPDNTAPQPRSGARWADVRVGLRYLGRSRVILLTFAIDIGAMALALPRALFPAVADDHFGPGSVGWLYSAIAIGSVLSGLVSGWIGRVRHQGRALILSVVGWGLAVAAAGLSPWLWGTVALLAVAGAADMISAVYRQTMLLTYAPDEMRGRLQGVFFAVVAGGPRLGDLRAGAMAEWTGTTVSWVAGGLAAAAVAIVLAIAFPVFRRYTARLE